MLQKAARKVTWCTYCGFEAPQVHNTHTGTYTPTHLRHIHVHTQKHTYRQTYICITYICMGAPYMWHTFVYLIHTFVWGTTLELLRDNPWVVETQQMCYTVTYTFVSQTRITFSNISRSFLDNGSGRKKNDRKKVTNDQTAKVQNCNYACTLINRLPILVKSTEFCIYNFPIDLEQQTDFCLCSKSIGKC